MTKTMLTPLLAAILLSVSLAADDAKKSEPTGDLKKLQGAWTAVSEAAGADPADAAVYTFKGDKLTIKGKLREYEMTVKLDESAKPEKSIDFKIDKAPDDAKGQTSKGIYKIEGDDKAVICFRPEGDRPEKFEQVNYEQFLTTLKRKKD